MANQLVILGVIPVFLLVASAKDILGSKQCEVSNTTAIMCNCNGNQDLSLPARYSFKNITTLSLSSCISANLSDDNVRNNIALRKITIQDIRDQLIFKIPTNNKFKELRLSNIHKIPLVTPDAFTNLMSIDKFELENVHIENFQQDFTDKSMTKFIVINSTIDNIQQMDLSEKNQELRIVNSKFRNIRKSLNFKSSNVSIINSIFELSEPGHVVITSNVAVVENCVFLNASINLMANESVRINSICADGSTLRLSANIIESFDNQLPTEIVYVGNSSVRRNNTICKGVNCNCQNSNGQDSYRCTSKFSLFIVFFIFLVRLM